MMIQCGKYRFFETEEDFHNFVKMREYRGMVQYAIEDREVIGYPSSYPVVLAYEKSFDPHFSGYFKTLSPSETTLILEETMHDIADEISSLRKNYSKLAKMYLETKTK